MKERRDQSSALATGVWQQCGIRMKGGDRLEARKQSGGYRTPSPRVLKQGTDLRQHIAAMVIRKKENRCESVSSSLFG